MVSHNSIAAEFRFTGLACYRGSKHAKCDNLLWGDMHLAGNQDIIHSSTIEKTAPFATHNRWNRVGITSCTSCGTFNGP